MDRCARRARHPPVGRIEIVQTYRLLSGSRRLDVETWIDWHERRVLLRALFP
jgi:alpha-mannosidase